MPIAYTRRKIAHLRKQPEHVRLRAASLMTIASGVVLVGLWLTILLPLQLRFSKPAEEESVPVATQQAQASLVPTTNSSQVGGARDLVLPTSGLSPLPSPTPLPTITSTPPVSTTP